MPASQTDDMSYECSQNGNTYMDGTRSIMRLAPGFDRSCDLCQCEIMLKARVDEPFEPLYLI